jgi:DNA polymerase-3 subunit beta
MIDDVIGLLEPVAQVCNGKIRPALWNCQVFKDWKGFRGTDLNSILSVGECSGEWFLCHAGRLLEILKSLPPGSEVIIDRDAKGIVIKSVNSKFALPVIDGDGYPAFSVEVNNAELVEVPADWLLDSYGRISPAIGKNTANATLSGVILHQEAGSISLVACDGRRLATSKLFKEGIEKALSCSIPVAVFKLLSSLMLGESVKFSIGKTTLLVSGWNWELRSCLIEGQIPPWQKILAGASGAPKATWEGSAGVLKKALSQSLLLAGEANRVEWAIEDGALYLQAATEEGGTADSAAVGETTGKIGSISANGRYMLDGLKGSGDNENCIIRITKPEKPFLISSVDSSFQTMIMGLT